MYRPLRKLITLWRSRSTVQEDVEKPLSFHLEELRTRLFYCVLAIVGFAIVGFIYAREIIGFLMGPLKRAVSGLDIPPQLHFTSLTEPLFQAFKIALFTGIFLGFPFWFWQLWKFVAPGLYDNEKRLARPFMISATSLFLMGASFAYTIAVPIAYHFLLLYANPEWERKSQIVQYQGPTFELRQLPTTHLPDSVRSTRPSSQASPASSGGGSDQTARIGGDGNVASATTKPTARIQIRESKERDQHNKIQFTISLERTEKSQSSLHAEPLQWLELLMKQSLFAIDWQRDHQRFHYQLQISWPNISHRSDLGELKPILTLQSYLSVSLWFLLGFALVFQTPLIIFMLILSGLITPQQFALYRRHTIVAILIISAVITPTGDPLNLMIMAIPMYILFEIGLLIARIYLRSHPTNTLDQATATDEETSGHG